MFVIRFWNAFVKLTGWSVQFFCFRTKVYYEDRSAQGRHIRVQNTNRYTAKS